MRRLLLTVGWTVATATALLAQPSTESPAAVAAKKRQEAIQSVEFVFHLKERIEPGSQSAGFPPGSAAKGFPAEAMTIESDNRLVIDGERVRLEMNHPMPDLRSNNWPPSRQVAVVNGDEAKSYYVLTEQDVTRRNSVATIRRPQQAGITRDLSLLPVLMNCRGFNPELCSWNFAETGWLVDGAPISVQGVTYQPYRHKAADLPTGSSLVCWADPARDHAIHKIRLDMSKGESYVLEAGFEKHDPSGIVLPSYWRRATYTAAGKLRSTREYTVTSVLVNHAPANNTFDLEFPPNVEVVNQIDGHSYLVRTDGSLQRLPHTGADSEHIRAEAASSWWRRNWHVMTAGIAVLLLLLVLRRRITLRHRT